MKDLNLKDEMKTELTREIINNYDQYYNGQQLLCRSRLFPKDMKGQEGIFRELGFSFSNYSPVDSMYSAVLPEGWNLVPTENVLWTRIIDENDNVRGLIYYNAVQNQAHASLKKRYGIYTKTDSTTIGDKEYLYKRVYFCEEDDEKHIVASIRICSDEPNVEEILDQLDSFESSAIEYANRKYPFWKDVRAYWGKPKSKQFIK